MTTLSLLKPARQPVSSDTLEAQLLAYEFPAAFAGRLAGEHGWTMPFTLEVLREYRRFLVLAATSTQSVTPSRTVDAAWHEHLTHTRDYWLRLTPLLPGALHHEPGEGKSGDTGHFAEQYEGTLELYRERFGEPDPRIWPDPARTQGRPARRRFNPVWWPFGLMVLGLLWMLGQTGWQGWGALVLAALGIGLIGALVSWLSNRPRKAGGGGSGDGDGGSLFAFAGDSGGNSDGGCSDSGSSDSGSSCGSSCGGGCSS